MIFYGANHGAKLKGSKNLWDFLNSLIATEFYLTIHVYLSKWGKTLFPIHSAKAYRTNLPMAKNN